MSRLEDLQVIREGAMKRLLGSPTDQNFVILGRLLVDVAIQIDELSGTGAKETTGVGEFMQRLNDRRAGTAAKNR